MSSHGNDFVKLSILNSDLVWKTKVACTTKINKLMAMAFSHFHGGRLHAKPPKGRMVLVKTRSILSADKTVGEEGLKDSDEVFLVEFPQTASEKQGMVNLRGPTTSEINEATKHLERRNTNNLGVKLADTEEDISYSERLTKDGPRIYISLIETAARLLAFVPNGMEIFHLVKNELSCKKEPFPHSPLVKQLTDMGFSEEMAVKALRAKKMEFTEAIDWLLEQGSVIQVTDPKDKPSTSQAEPLNTFDAFQDLLQSSLKRRHDNFKPNIRHTQQLKLMGYEENDIENALRETDNNLKAAISCLKRSMTFNTPPGKLSGLDVTGPTYKALMASEKIQLNLKKPKFLYALFAILEDPQCFSLWLKDPEVGFVLNELVLIHNTETSGGRRMT